MILVRVLATVRLVGTGVLLLEVYLGSRWALVCVLGLIVIAHELQALLWRRYVTDAHEALLRTAAFRAELRERLRNDDDV